MTEVVHQYLALIGLDDGVSCFGGLGAIGNDRRRHFFALELYRVLDLTEQAHIIGHVVQSGYDPIEAGLQLLFGALVRLQVSFVTGYHEPALGGFGIEYQFFQPVQSVVDTGGFYPRTE